MCFGFIDAQTSIKRYSYAQVRLIAANMARQLQERGICAGSCITIDLPNCPEFVFLLLAAAYGGFSLAPLNKRLTEEEKQSRIVSLKLSRSIECAAHFDKMHAHELFLQARSALAGNNLERRPIMGARQDAKETAIHFAERQAHLFDENSVALIMFTSGTTGKAKAVPLTWHQLQASAASSNAALNVFGEGLWQVPLPLFHIGGMQVAIRSILNEMPFLLYERFDARKVLADAKLYSATHISVVDKMLQDLLDVAEGKDAQAAASLANYSCVLLGGGALNRKTLLRALRANARVYASYGMTETSSQIANSLVTPRFDGGMQLMSGYTVRIVDADSQGYGRLAVRGPGVFSGYANARAAFTVDGFFLTGDAAALKDNKLYVKERTCDMFVSGGENIYPAEIVERLLQVPGVADACVFGVPHEKWGRRPVGFIERAHADSDVRVDAAACMGAGAGEGAGAGAGVGAGAGARAGEGSNIQNDQAFSSYVYKTLAPSLSKLYMPQYLFTLPKLPRTGIGKIDKQALSLLYENRLEIKKITLYLLSIPFKEPFKTAKTTLSNRESLLVEVTDWKGRTGLGECVAFASDWYLPETIEQDLNAIKRDIAPCVLDTVYLHPREALPSFEALDSARNFPLACGAVESALWDLYGKIVQKPLWQLILEEAGAAGVETGASAGTGVDGCARKEMGAAGAHKEATTHKEAGARDSLPGAQNATSHEKEKPDSLRITSAGAVVGITSPVETVETVRRCVQAGYKRIKLKVAPGSLACVQEVRKEFPQLMLTLDANQSFGEQNMSELRAIDKCGAAWIEEPLDISRIPQRSGKEAVFARLAQLQRTLSTPICLDESFTCAREAYRALSYPELRCFAIKVGKFGGISAALEFAQTAQARGACVWMGGMYDTGISKRMHSAFQMLPGIDAPGDVGATSRYFAQDVTDPPYAVVRGMVSLNTPHNECGLGCNLCLSALANVQVKRWILE